MGYVAAFGVVILLGIGIYCFGYASRKAPLLQVLLLETGLSLLLIFPLMLFVDRYSLKDIFTLPEKQNWLWLSAASLFGFVGGNYFSLWNLRTAGEKINSLLSPAITALTIVLSYFVFGERLSILQALGVVLTLTTVVAFLIRRSGYGAYQHSTEGAVSGMATIICISLTIICSIKGASGSISYLLAIWLRLLMALPMIGVAFLWKREGRGGNAQDSSFYPAILLGILAQTIGAAYLWLYASFHVPISVFQSILATLPLWMYGADVYVLKKSKPSFIFLIACFLSGIGIFTAMLL